MYRKLFATAGVLIAAGLLWMFVIGPYLTPRIEKGWSIEAEFLGDIVFGEGMTFPDERSINVFKHTQKANIWSPERVQIRDEYTTYDIQTNEVTWGANVLFDVDPWTGEVLEMDGEPIPGDVHYVFPQNCQKQDYRKMLEIRQYVTAEFVREDELLGIPVYVYSFQSPLDVTKSYAPNDNFEGIVPPEGQCVYSKEMAYEWWVEPRTGSVVRVAEASKGDYFADAETKELLTALTAWSGITESASVDKLVARARGRLRTFCTHRYYIPGVLLGLGVVLLVGALMLRKRRAEADGGGSIIA